MASVVAARWRNRALGVVLGLVAAGVVLALINPGPERSPTGPTLSDCDGPLRELAVQYIRAGAPITAPALAQFLGRLRPDVTVRVVCSEQADYDDLLGRIGRVECTLAPVVVGHPITGWSRDRWIAMEPVRAGDPMWLVSPRGERASDVWPARRGDEKVGADLASHLGRGYAAVRSDLFFDGGDFVADRRTVFVAPAVIGRNVHQTVDSREELQGRLERLTGRRVVLLPDAPDHHAGMFMMVAGQGTVVVGDPAAGRRLWDAMAPDRRAACFPKEPDWTDATREKFDSVARACEAAGYRVVRMPTVGAADQRTYLSYVNVIIDDAPGGRIVYMPVYRGADELNQAAQRVWEGLGYEVRPIDCTATLPHFGALRCLVSVLRRG